jgi:hypothetical protein
MAQWRDSYRKGNVRPHAQRRRDSFRPNSGASCGQASSWARTRQLLFDGCGRRNDRLFSNSTSTITSPVVEHISCIADPSNLTLRCSRFRFLLSDANPRRAERRRERSLLNLGHTLPQRGLEVDRSGLSSSAARMGVPSYREKKSATARMMLDMANDAIDAQKQ